jgi:hypothetical protein
LVTDFDLLTGNRKRPTLNAERPMSNSDSALSVGRFLLPNSMTHSTSHTQSTNSVLMIRAVRFYPNPDTAADNAFQRDANRDLDALTVAARNEFDAAVQTLRAGGVTVHVFEDTAEPEKPDAVFPNNWISTHRDGRIALFPMYSKLRRRERRQDIVEELRKHYRVTDVIDYSAFEDQGYYLEGTGSLVLDHLNKIAYLSLSNRSNPKMIERFANDFSYEPVTFTSIGSTGQPIYHTNVMMCIGTNFAMVGLETILNKAERQQVRARLEKTGKEIVELSADQIANFAGNAIELQNTRGEKLLVLSSRAAEALTGEQRERLTRYTRLMQLELPTIELGGGSARCMIATIHLPPRS